MAAIKPEQTTAGLGWRIFFKRTWAAYAISIFWIVESRMKQDVTGFYIAAFLGFIATAVGYLWTRNSRE
jgi:hypothetical protein